MPRYVAFLRGVSPMNAKMADLRAAFEAGGFTAVRTVLSSGNVAFDAHAAPEADLARRAEAAMEAHLGHAFPVIVRSTRHLGRLVESDPYARFDVDPSAKRVVTFLAEPPPTAPTLSPETDGVRMLATEGGEVFTAYVPGPRGPVFMRLIEKTLGKNVTTRTWETVQRCARA